jgi:hypothetical protein
MLDKLVRDTAGSFPRGEVTYAVQNNAFERTNKFFGEIFAGFGRVYANRLIAGRRAAGNETQRRQRRTRELCVALPWNPYGTF